MDIYALRFEEKMETGLFEYLLQFVDKEKRTKIKRFVKWEDAHRGLFAELLIRQIITEKTGLANEAISFSKNRYGKPFLNNMTGFHFNLSHSGLWIVCAVDNMPIGIDIQKIKPVDFGISERYFSKEEHNDLMSKSDSDKLAYFFTLWALKESYIKAKGKGLSIPLKSFYVKAESLEKIIFKFEDRDEKNSYFIQYDLDRNYKMAVCAQNNKFPKKIIIIRSNTLIQGFKGEK